MRPLGDEDFDENGQLKDGHRYRVPMRMMDNRDPHVTDGTDRLDGLHKPGFRKLSDAALSDAREAEYRAYNDELVNAWKHDPPSGAYPLSAGEGRACTVNGFPGTLVREGNYLVCKPTERDAAPKMDARGAALQEYERQLVNAWRGGQ